MTKQRRITVKQEYADWQDDNREVCIEVWHNPNQTSTLRLSRGEAEALLADLLSFLNGDVAA